MEDKEDKEELMNNEELTTLPTPQGTSHCSCLEHCFLFIHNTGANHVGKLVFNQLTTQEGLSPNTTSYSIVVF